MPLKTKRWDEPLEADDGTRILICRYRPRGLRKENETWSEWLPDLAPSAALHAAAYGTYLNLELYDPAEYLRALRALFPGLGPLAGRAAARSAKLDGEFIRRTNLRWQRKHGRRVLEKLGAGAPGKKGREPLALPASVGDNRLFYLFAERWFERMGL